VLGTSRYTRRVWSLITVWVCQPTLDLTEWRQSVTPLQWWVRGVATGYAGWATTYPVDFGPIALQPNIESKKTPSSLYYRRNIAGRRFVPRPAVVPPGIPRDAPTPGRRASPCLRVQCPSARLPDAGGLASSCPAVRQPATPATASERRYTNLPSCRLPCKCKPAGCTLQSRAYSLILEVLNYVNPLIQSSIQSFLFL
jgi:hypothetical protein